MFLNTLKNDLYRGIVSVNFLLAVVCSFVILYWGAGSDIYNTNDYLYIFTYSFLENNSFSLFIIACTLACSGSFCDDWDSRFLVPTVIRSNKTHYGISKCVACAISGGLSVVIGIISFLLFLIAIGFHSGEPIMSTSYSFHSLLSNQAYFGYFALLCVVMFFACGFYSLFGLCVSSFAPNKYIAIASPFIFNTLYLEIFKMLRLPRYFLLQTLANSKFHFGSTALDLIVPIAIFLFLMIICSIIFIKNVSRRISDV